MVFTGKEDNGAGGGTAHQIHDGRGREVRVCQGDVAPVLGVLPCTVIILLGCHAMRIGTKAEQGEAVYIRGNGGFKAQMGFGGRGLGKCPAIAPRSVAAPPPTGGHRRLGERECACGSEGHFISAFCIIPAKL